MLMIMTLGLTIRSRAASACPLELGEPAAIGAGAARTELAAAIAATALSADSIFCAECQESGEQAGGRA